MKTTSEYAELAVAQLEITQQLCAEGDMSPADIANGIAVSQVFATLALAAATEAAR